MLEYSACRVLTERLSADGFQVETGVGGLPTAFGQPGATAGVARPWDFCASTMPLRDWDTDAAKLEMWNNGCFRDTDLALMTHASVETAADLSALAQVKLTVTFHGQSAHAAMYPERGRSAFDALQLLFQFCLPYSLIICTKA